MPVYCFVCPKCQASAEHIRTMEHRNDPLRCPCGTLMKRDIRRERCASTDQEYLKPVLSESVGCHPDQVAEHRRTHPDIPITDQGQVVFTSHNQRKRVLKRLGYFDRDGYG